MPKSRIDILNTKIQKEIPIINDLRREYRILGNKMTRRINKTQGWIEERDTLIIAELKEKGEIDYELVLQSGDSKPFYDYTASVLGEMGLMTFGGFRKTNQIRLQIILYKNKDAQTTKTFESLNILLPYIKPLKHERTGTMVKVLSIFDYRLSQDGGWELHIEDSGKVHLVNGDWGRRKEFEDLKSALTYCQHNHWYQESENE